MHTHARKIFFSWALLCLFSLFSGCSSLPYRIHPDFQMEAKSLQAPGLVAWDIEIFEVTENGMVERRDDWSRRGQANIQNALLKGFREKHYKATSIRSKDLGPKNELQELRALYRTVNKSIQIHTYGPQLFPEKRRDFEYSLGSLEKILGKNQADSVVFVSGRDFVSNEAALAYLSLTLADASGKILWYCVRGSRGKHDLRDPQSAAALVEMVLSSFPEAGG